MEANGFNTKVEWDPTNIEFGNWLALKFRNQKIMDPYTKNALWDYWRRGDDDETPVCKAFKDFNYLLEIDVDVLTKNIPRFKTYEEYKDDWIYEWNKGMDQRKATDDEVWIEPIDNIYHECEALRFKSNLIRYQDYEWYDALEDSDLKNEALINKAILEKSMNDEEESSDDAWSHYSPIDEWKDYEKTTYIETNVSSNHNIYNNVCHIIMDHNAGQSKQGWFDKHELMGDKMMT
nr:VIER F-box protein 2 [Tanacetum cinerariifolium]